MLLQQGFKRAARQVAEDWSAHRPHPNERWTYYIALMVIEDTQPLGPEARGLEAPLVPRESVYHSELSTRENVLPGSPGSALASRPARSRILRCICADLRCEHAFAHALTPLSRLLLLSGRHHLVAGDQSLSLFS